jgi:hypothetical protein
MLLRLQCAKQTPRGLLGICSKINASIVPTTAIPAQQAVWNGGLFSSVIPACAGMTGEKVIRLFPHAARVTRLDH